MSIEYKTNIAVEKMILEHLLHNSPMFIPPLKTVVNIPEYAQKIIHMAERFEAWNDNKLVGLVACYFNDVNKKNGFITNVSVDPEHVKKGIASKLLELCINYGKQENYHCILLEVNKENRAAKQLYENFGFEHLNESEETEFYQLKLK